MRTVRWRKVRDGVWRCVLAKVVRNGVYLWSHTLQVVLNDQTGVFHWIANVCGETHMGEADSLKVAKRRCQNKARDVARAVSAAVESLP